jgi:hypothetical protein
MDPEQEKRINNRLLKIVKALPGNLGWWHEEGREAFMELGWELVRAGVGLTEIEARMKAVYNAVRQEYGD